MTVIPTGFAQANFRLEGSGLPTGAECTLGLDLTAFGGTPDQSASNCWTAWATNIMPRLVATVQLVSVSVKWGPAATGPTGEHSQVQTGGAGGAGASSAIAALVHKNTNAGGRAGRGRMFIPGLQESDVSPAGVLDSGAVTAWATSLDDFLTDLDTAGHNAVLLHGAGSPLTIPNAITSLTIDSVVATQRRRQRR